MGLRLVYAWLWGVICGALLLAFVVYPPSPNWGADEKWGDIGTWFGAIASFGAIVVALTLAGAADRKDAKKRDDTAAMIATAICDEPRTNRHALEEGADIFRIPSGPEMPLEARYAALTERLGVIRVSVFLLFKDAVPSLGRELSVVIATAYGTMSTSRDVEREMLRLGRPGTREMTPLEV